MGYSSGSRENGALAAARARRVVDELRRFQAQHKRASPR